MRKDEPKQQSSEIPRQRPRGGLFRRREILVPTWRGCLVLLVVCGLLLFVFTRVINPFLSVNDSKPGGVMVVEGWAPDFALRQAMAEFGREHYDKLYVTGGPLEQGAPLSEFKTYAELGTATLVKFGFRTNDVQPVPAPGVAKDRTYSSAVALREWWQQHGEPMPASLNLITLGPHARRSRLLFEKAMGKKVAVGVISIDEHGYDQKHWWRTSQGVRTTIGEAVAYLYARLWFRAPKA